MISPFGPAQLFQFAHGELVLIHLASVRHPKKPAERAGFFVMMERLHLPVHLLLVELIAPGQVGILPAIDDTLPLVGTIFGLVAFETVYH